MLSAGKLFHSFKNSYFLTSGITAILKKIGCCEQNCEGTTVAIGDSMFEEHHLVKSRTKQMVAQLMGKDCEVKLELQKGDNVTFHGYGIYMSLIIIIIKLSKHVKGQETLCSVVILCQLFSTWANGPPCQLSPLSIKASDTPSALGLVSK